MSLGPLEGSKVERCVSDAQKMTSQKANKDVPKKAIVIEPLEMPNRRGRGVSGEPMKKNVAPSSGITSKSTSEVRAAKTKEELIAERKQKLKDIEARKEKKIDVSKKDSSITGVMKNSVSRTQKLLADFQV